MKRPNKNPKQEDARQLKFMFEEAGKMEENTQPPISAETINHDLRSQSTDSEASSLEHIEHNTSKTHTIMPNNNTNDKTPTKYVADYVDQFQKDHPNIKCAGEIWFEGKAGTWVQVDLDTFIPEAQRLLGREKETNARAREVLRTFAGRSKLHRGECFSTFAKMKGHNCVLVNCQNGVVKVTPDNIELMKHDLRYMFTKQFAAAYNL